MLLLFVVPEGFAGVLSDGGRPGEIALAFREVVERGTLGEGLKCGSDAGVGSGCGADAWLARDKARHAGYSFIGTLAAASVLGSLGMVEADCAPWGAASVFSLGLFKEAAMDWGEMGSRASWRDGVADLAGVLAAWLITRGD